MKRNVHVSEDEDKMARVEQLWKILNDKGIYTEKQLYEELEKVKLDIGMFTLRPEDEKVEEK